MKTRYTVALSMFAGAALGAAAIEALHAQAKPPVYLITEIDVTNVDAYTKEYVPKVRATIKAAGGRVLGASQKVTPVEGEPPKSRVSINAWVSLEKMQAWRASLYSGELRQACIFSRLSQALMVTRDLGGSPSTGVTFWDAPGTRPPHPLIVPRTFGTYSFVYASTFVTSISVIKYTGGLA